MRVCTAAGLPPRVIVVSFSRPACMQAYMQRTGERNRCAGAAVVCHATCREAAARAYISASPAVIVIILLFCAERHVDEEMSPAAAAARRRVGARRRATGR